MPFAENVDECGRHQCWHYKSNKNNNKPLKKRKQQQAIIIASWAVEDDFGGCHKVCVLT